MPYLVLCTSSQHDPPVPSLITLLKSANSWTKSNLANQTPIDPHGPPCFPCFLLPIAFLAKQILWGPKRYVTFVDFWCLNHQKTAVIPHINPRVHQVRDLPSVND